MRVVQFLRQHWVVAVVAAVGIVAAVAAYDRLARERPAPHYESDQDHFLHGSIGAETLEGVPYWVWLVLPRVVPDLLPAPGGYPSLGMVTRPGYDMPIGLSRVTIGYPRVAVNCAFCHTATVRARPDAMPTIVPGAPAHQTAVQRYGRFLAAAAADPRFTATTILGEIARNYRLSAVDRLLYRLWVIPRTRQRLVRLGALGEWMDERPDWGHGRADIFSPVKFHRLGQARDAAIGSADIMPLWSDTSRKFGFFWDGMHASLQDAVVTSALSAGSSRPWLDRDLARWDRTDARGMSSLRRIHNYLATLEPPAYPFAIDRTIAAAGEPVFQAACASCHAAGAGGARSPGVGTDEQRGMVWTVAASDAYDAFALGRAWKSSGFVRDGGYVASSLEGVWLRAPYLHNGSVPTLADLLEAAPGRPARFWRGYDVYDQTSVGFVSDGPEAARVGTLYDTSLPGNANTGHEYGIDLPAPSKRALLEYLKTL